MKTIINGSTLELVIGNITQQAVDAVVNAANSQLAGGAGVDGAIHNAGGPSIMEETARDYPHGCPTGSAVITTAGNLPAKRVIHAVGPIHRASDDRIAEQLADAYRSSLQLAVQHNCQSVAFPAISMGAYGYPHDQASRIALETMTAFLQEHGRPQLVRFVLFDASIFEIFQATLSDLLNQDQ